MSNLQEILRRDVPFLKIVKMGGVCDHPETNIRLHPAACRGVIDICQSRGIELTFVTLDTTGFGLKWIDKHDGVVSFRYRYLKGIRI